MVILREAVVDLRIVAQMEQMLIEKIKRLNQALKNSGDVVTFL